MNKQTFLTELRKALSGLPREDVEERLAFYGEMIDDRVEEGASEEDAIAGIGTVNEIASQIVSDVPITKIVKERIKPKRAIKAWQTVLVILGFPLWFSLFAAAASVLLSIYAVIWSLVISLWAVESSMISASAGCIIVTVVYAVRGFPVQGAAAFGLGLFCAGLSMFLVSGCFAASKGVVRLTKRMALGVKKTVIGRENIK